MNSVEALDVAISAVRARRDRAARVANHHSRNTAVNMAREHRLDELTSALVTLTVLRETIAESFGGTTAARSLP